MELFYHVFDFSERHEDDVLISFLLLDRWFSRKFSFLLWWFSDTTALNLLRLAVVTNIATQFSNCKALNRINDFA